MNLQSCDMTDVSLPTGAAAAKTVLVDDCNIKFENSATFIGYDKYKPSITVSNSVLDLSKVEGEFQLVNAWSVEDTEVNYLFSNNEVIKPESLTGYILYASWVREATAENKLTITFDGTNLDELTDCNKATGNFVIVRDTTSN